jgi:hypothetical protein
MIEGPGSGFVPLTKKHKDPTDSDQLHIGSKY